jgi:hypothetical protein
MIRSIVAVMCWHVWRKKRIRGVGSGGKHAAEVVAAALQTRALSWTTALGCQVSAWNHPNAHSCGETCLFT